LTNVWIRVSTTVVSYSPYQHWSTSTTCTVTWHLSRYVSCSLVPRSSLTPAMAETTVKD